MVSAAKDTAGLMEAVKAGPQRQCGASAQPTKNGAACIALTAVIRLKVPQRSASTTQPGVLVAMGVMDRHPNCTAQSMKAGIRAPGGPVDQASALRSASSWQRCSSSCSASSR